MNINININMYIYIYAYVCKALLCMYVHVGYSNYAMQSTLDIIGHDSKQPHLMCRAHNTSLCASSYLEVHGYLYVGYLYVGLSPQKKTIS